MHIYEYKLGDISKLAVYEDDEQAYERRAEIEPTFDFLPVKITRFVMEGYEIIVRRAQNPIINVLEDMGELRQALLDKGIKVPANTGAERLRALAAEHLV